MARIFERYAAASATAASVPRVQVKPRVSRCTQIIVSMAANSMTAASLLTVTARNENCGRNAASAAVASAPAPGIRLAAARYTNHTVNIDSSAVHSRAASTGRYQIQSRSLFTKSRGGARLTLSPRTSFATTIGGSFDSVANGAIAM